VARGHNSATRLSLDYTKTNLVSQINIFLPHSMPSSCNFSTSFPLCGFLHQTVFIYSKSKLISKKLYFQRRVTAMWLKKKCLTLHFSPYLKTNSVGKCFVSFLNKCLSTGTIPELLKHTVTPLLKKPSLDDRDFNHFRPFLLLQKHWRKRFSIKSSSFLAQIKFLKLSSLVSSLCTAPSLLY